MVEKQRVMRLLKRKRIEIRRINAQRRGKNDSQCLRCVAAVGKLCVDQS
jgi:hypothetical protein